MESKILLGREIDFEFSKLKIVKIVERKKFKYYQTETKV